MPLSAGRRKGAANKKEVKKMEKFNVLDWITMIILIIGGINWGLIGFFDYNLVESLFGSGTLATVIYDLVGLSAIYTIYTLTKMGRS